MLAQIRSVMDNLAIHSIHGIGMRLAAGVIKVYYLCSLVSSMRMTSGSDWSGMLQSVMFVSCGAQGMGKTLDLPLNCFVCDTSS